MVLWGFCFLYCEVVGETGIIGSVDQTEVVEVIHCGVV